MKKFNTFIKNGLILTSTSLLLRWISVSFNAYISNNLGTEGMGIYSLVQSVFGFSITFACSGINLGTVRLISEAIAKDSNQEIKKTFLRSVLYSSFFSGIAFVVMFFGADFIGTKLLGDTRTILSVRTLAISLPFISLSSVFNGYFTAVRRVYKNAFSMILEQATQIFITVNFFSILGSHSVKYACLGVALGTVVAEIISFIYNMIMWLYDIRKHKINNNPPESNLTNKLLKISLPLAFSAYIRSGLITVEHLLIPYSLRLFGESYSKSMSVYGLIQGMVFPVIMFPSCIIYSFAGLLVPELSILNQKKDYPSINRLVTKVLKYALIFAIGVSGILICYSFELCTVIYKSAEAGNFIRLFAPLVCVMYLDGAVDAMLKGLNRQLHSMKINIADALLSATLVYLLIPRMGVIGYIITIFICEIFNCCMSFTHLIQVCEPDFNIFKNVFIPVIYISFSTLSVTYIFHHLKFIRYDNTNNLIVRIMYTVIIYLVLNSISFKKIIQRKKTIKNEL